MNVASSTFLFGFIPVLEKDNHHVQKRHDLLVSTARLARRRLSRFARQCCGAVLIEFSLIAFLLLFVIFSTIEISLVYWATEQIENGEQQRRTIWCALARSKHRRSAKLN